MSYTSIAPTLLKPPLQLVPSDQLLSDLCTTVELQLSTVQELEGMSLPVELLPDFASLPEADQSQVIRDTYAAYRRSTATIYVNGEAFGTQVPNIMQAVIAHEIGHAYAHQVLSNRLPSAYEELGPYGEEFLADRLACLWGFFDGLSQERLASYRTPYVTALAQWTDELAYCKAMEKWRMQRIAGIV